MAILDQDFHCSAINFPLHGSSHDIEWTNFNHVTKDARDYQGKKHPEPHLVGLLLGGGLVLLAGETCQFVCPVIVDGRYYRLITAYRKVIAGVSVMSLFKNTSFIAKLMAKMAFDQRAVKTSLRIWNGLLSFFSPGYRLYPKLIS